MHKNILKLLSSIALCQGAGLLGTLFTVSSIKNWYNFLNQPFFRPPNWLFGPVWTVLYTLMGISLYCIWMKGTRKKEIREALKIFAIQLFLNASWSIVFFGLHNIFLAFVNIVLLWILIIMVIIKFNRVDETAARLLLPYLAWVSFAAFLNYHIWLLNR